MVVNFSYKQIQVLFVLFSLGFSFPICALGQKYYSKYNQSEIEVNEKVYIGLSTRFAFNEKQVKKGFWRYCKSFAKLVNQKTYYEVVIPASENEANTDVFLYATIQEQEEEAVFSLALSEDKLQNDQIPRYKTQVRSIIVDFKKEFYISYWQKDIDRHTKEAAKLSKRYERLKKKNSTEGDPILGQIKTLENKVSELRKRQFSVSTN